MPRAKAAKRELINTGTDKRFVRRDGKGQFNESDDVGRSLSQDRRRSAKTTPSPDKAIAEIESGNVAVGAVMSISVAVG